MQTDTITRLVERGKAKRPELASRLERAAMIALFRTVELTDPETHEYRVESEERPGSFYRVNGVCSCADHAHRAPGGWCKHRLSVALIERATADEQAANDRAAVLAEWQAAVTVKGY
jgi:predicted aminopeptidase